MKVHWTGHPFVDAGLAAVAAVVKVAALEDLTPEDLEKAARELERVLLSDQALGLGVERAFARTTMSQIFPNSPLVNPSNWMWGRTNEEKVENVRRKFRNALAEQLQKAKVCLQNEGGQSFCTACGRRCPEEATVFVRKDTMPLLSGIVNFYPAFAYGMRLCGLCAFAVHPFFLMSVMRTGVYNRLWFLHTQALPIAKEVSFRYGWFHFNRLIAANEPLELFSRWETVGDAGTVLYLFCELLENMGDRLREIYHHPSPTTAYVFSNHLLSTFVHPIPIPNDLLRFFAHLQLRSRFAFQRFWWELLKVPSGLKGQERKAREEFVSQVADRLLNTQSILRSCLDDETPKLRGGWLGHRLYLEEVVMEMSKTKLAVLEQLGTQIAQSEDAKKRIVELKIAHRNKLYGILLRYVREGWLKHDEFYTLLPPGDYGAAEAVRDILLAVIYEWQHCQQQGEEFPFMEEVPSLPSPDETLQRIQAIGERLVTGLPNLKRWIGELQTAKSPQRIRDVYLTALRRGALRFDDFVFLAPLDDLSRMWLLRDYLLAFLFERAKEALPEEEEIAVGAEETPLIGGEG